MTVNIMLLYTNIHVSIHVVKHNIHVVKHNIKVSIMLSVIPILSYSLGESHALRYDARFPKIETRLKPESRNHQMAHHQAREAMDFKGSRNSPKHPRKDSGINEISPLTHCPLFDSIWDHPMDFMHIVEGAMKSHIIPLLKGDRTPPHVKPLTRADITRQEMQQHKRDLKQRQKDLSAVHKLERTDMQRAFMDERSFELGGECAWIRGNLAIFRRTGSVIAHDWMRIVLDAEGYIFHGMFDDDPDGVYMAEALSDLMAILRASMHATCDEDSCGDSQNCSCVTLSHKIRRALCIVEREFPRTEMSINQHQIVHIPELIHRWNNVRNYWAFFSERLDIKMYIYTAIT
jgi:hypothetical protein